MVVSVPALICEHSSSGSSCFSFNFPLTPTLSHGFCQSSTDWVNSFKALALGANFVQLGRPILWGLAHEGEAGVRHVLKSLLAELEITVGLAGCASLKDVNATLLVGNTK